VKTVFDDEKICTQWQKDGILLQVSVSFVGPISIRRLNREFREIDETTDVLSFPMLEMKNGSIDQPLTAADFDQSEGLNVVFLGDVIINIDQAYRQAEEYGHSREREVSFLIIHSILHLLGYDHIEKSDERIMKIRQEILMDLMQIAR
jgi:probable rRNA maturation factor